MFVVRCRYFICLELSFLFVQFLYYFSNFETFKMFFIGKVKVIKLYIQKSMHAS